MAFDLLDTLKSLFSDEFSGKAAARLGETEAGVRKAMNGIIPVVLTGLLHKAGSPGNTADLMAHVKDVSGTYFTHIPEGLPGDLLGKGGDILRFLFGGGAGDISRSIAGYADIKTSSAESLLQTAAPVSLGVAGQQAGGKDLTASSLLSTLNNQKEKILSDVPAGLGLTNVLGVNNLGDISRKLSGVAGSVTRNVRDAMGTADRRARNRWLWMLLLLAAVLLLLWYWLKGCNAGSGDHSTDTITVAGMEQSAIDEVTEDPFARESIKVTLPDGKQLNAYKGGIEDQLVSFLQDPNTTGGKDKWFDFDHLNFKTGSAELTEESQIQIRNLAAILHAFPKTKVKIGGYTDRIGDSVANITLSRERAESVLRSLQAGQVRPVQLLGAEGYGSMYAKASADAPNEERKLDRRISVCVREK